MPDELLHFAETDFEFAFLHPLPVGVISGVPKLVPGTAITFLICSVSE